MLKRLAAISAVIFGLLLLYGCGSTSGSSSGAFDTPVVYFSTVEDVTVEVAYENGAAPFAGKINAGPLNGQYYWSILEDNLKAVFSGRDVTIAVPKELSEMSVLPTQNKTSWTTNDILNTASKFRKNVSTKTHAYFFVMFVNGYLSSDGQQQTNVIGVNIKGTPILAIFKEVVTATGQSQTGPVPKYVEQSTMVHETGHALGLVSNGVPMVVNHLDTANGAHCTNQNCVMYYLNTGLEAATKFGTQLSTTGSKIMYGNECLADFKAYKP